MTRHEYSIQTGQHDQKPQQAEITYTYTCGQCGHVEFSVSVITTCPACLGGMGIDEEN